MTLAQLLEQSTVASLEVKPGEVLLIKSHVKLTADQGKAIVEHTHRVLPGVPVLIVDADLDIAVGRLHPAPPGSATPAGPHDH